MEIKTLKANIENKKLNSSPLIFKYEDTDFLCDQYLNAIAEIRNLKILYLNSLDEYSTEESFFGEEDPYLYVYKNEKLLQDILPEYSNLVVICKSVPNSLSVDYIEFPKVQTWQVEDFIKSRVPGLSEQEIKWLCDVAHYDIYRLNHECEKLEIFPEATQEVIFNQLNNERGYIDLNNLTIMNLTNAIMNKDLDTISTILSDLKYIDIEGTGLTTLLLKQFKSLIEVSFNDKWNSSLSCSEKQFKYLKYNKKFTGDQSVNIYEFLINLDYRLKKGDFQFKLDNRENNSAYVGYIISNVLKFI